MTDETIPAGDDEGTFDQDASLGAGERMDAESWQRTEGPTSDRGAYAIAHFRDAGGRPCPRERAARIDIDEFDKDGVLVRSTIAYPRLWATHSKRNSGR